MKTVSMLITLALLAGCQAKAAEAKNRKMHLLFVVHANQGQYSEGKLMLTDVGKGVSYFSDRPVRKAGMVEMEKFLTAWSKNEKDNFSQNPPNASLVAYEGAGDKYSEVTVEIQNPNYERNMLTFDVKFIGEKKLDENAHLEGILLFIDDEPVYFGPPPSRGIGPG